MDSEQDKSTTNPKLITKGNREVITDNYVTSSIKNNKDDYTNKVFIRLNAKKVAFDNVLFTHCIFDACYINTCTFNSCDFTGSKFIGSNFHQSSFRGCKFDYVVFERCQIDDDILESEAPREDNLRMRFARSLRMNYQQIGDAKAVNKAISVELDATSTYLKKSWSSEETYYRKKYKGIKRLSQFAKWLEFSILDFIWGNGESIYKLARTILIINLAIGAYDASLTKGALNSNIIDYTDAIFKAPSIFLGINNAQNQYPSIALITITTSRLLSLSFLTAILVKRLGRR